MIDGMGTTPEYEAFAIMLSALCLALGLVYLRRVVISYQQWHDERAAVSLGKGVGIVVIALGLLISSLGYLADTGTLAIAGLSVARGAMLVLISTVLLVNIRDHAG